MTRSHVNSDLIWTNQTAVNIYLPSPKPKNRPVSMAALVKGSNLGNYLAMSGANPPKYRTCFVHFDCNCSSWIGEVYVFTINEAHASTEIYPLMTSENWLAAKFICGPSRSRRHVFWRHWRSRNGEQCQQQRQTATAKVTLCVMYIVLLPRTCKKYCMKQAFSTFTLFCLYFGSVWNSLNWSQLYFMWIIQM